MLAKILYGMLYYNVQHWIIFNNDEGNRKGELSIVHKSLRYCVLFTLFTSLSLLIYMLLCLSLILGVMDIPIVLFNISSKVILYLECYLLSPKNLKKLSKKIKHSKEYIIVTKIWGVSITVIYHAMSLTVLYKTNLLPFWFSVHLVLGW